MSSGAPVSDLGNPLASLVASDLAAKNDVAFAKNVIVRFHAHGWRHRRIGQHYVEVVQRELGQEPVGLVLPTDEQDVLLGAEQGRENPLREHLGEDVGDSDGEAKGHALGASGHGVHQLAAGRENSLGVAVHHHSEIRQRQVAPDAFEELATERHFESSDLAAQRRLSQAKLVGGVRDGAEAGGRPEIEQVVIVEPLHRGSPSGDCSIVKNVTKSEFIYFSICPAGGKTRSTSNESRSASHEARRTVSR
jgi:hypothetical protein